MEISIEKKICVNPCLPADRYPISRIDGTGCVICVPEINQTTF